MNKAEIESFKKKEGKREKRHEKVEKMARKMGSGVYEEGKNGRVKEQSMKKYLKNEKDFEKKKKELYG